MLSTSCWVVETPGSVNQRVYLRKEDAEQAIEVSKGGDQFGVLTPVVREVDLVLAFGATDRRLTPAGARELITELPDPTEADLMDPLFEAIYAVIKRWDVGVPGSYEGYCGAMGNHAKVILDAIRDIIVPNDRPTIPSDRPGPAWTSAHFDVRARLMRMRETPRMHAQTREAFLLMALLLLEFEGVASPDWLGQAKGPAIPGLDEQVDNEWARDIIDRALALLPPDFGPIA